MRADLAPALLIALAACASAPPPGKGRRPAPDRETTAATPASAPSTPSATAPAADPAADPSADPAPASEPEPEPSAACPADMVLVDGDYCTELELRCLRSTYAPQNKKVVCHEFAEPSRCTGDKVKKRFCVDRYEYPNRAGERPTVMHNFPEAQRLCAEQGKRLCTESEWTMACEGPGYKPYPYGYVRDPEKCRGDRAYRFPKVDKLFGKNEAAAREELERLWDGLPSGSQPECVSDYGVFDMPGNADEFAASESSPPRSTFESVTTGGPWVAGVRNQCRPKIYEHNEGFRYYYLSFRCCAEADGQPTDPRTPKQIRRKIPWKG